MFNSDLWPDSSKFTTRTGFPDEYLEEICTDRVMQFDLARGFYDEPEIFWTQSIYSLGRCYRDWLRWPRWLPIPAYTDHGVWQSPSLSHDEVKSNAQLHLSWNRFKVANSMVSNKKVIQVSHPWVFHRRREKISKKANSFGTVVFVPHTVPGTSIEADWDRYFSNLRALDDVFRPFVLCVHMHDVRKGLHKRLRQYGFPIVTAGETLSPRFVDRFYDLISSFNYATSAVGGTELFLCEEMGLRFFIYNHKDAYLVNENLVEKPAGHIEANSEMLRVSLHARKVDLFSVIPPKYSEEKAEFIDGFLGLADNEVIDESEVREMILNQVWLHWREICKVWFKWVVRRLKYSLIFSRKISVSHTK